ncbi:MAG: helical backbone metal receptor [Acidimicrobiales bacterium]
MSSEPSSGQERVRVVSLVPSVTETIRAFGLDPVACTRFCERPDLLHVGGTKDPDIAAIIALAPDLVVVEREENRLEDHDALARAGLEVMVLHITALEEVTPEMGRLADRLETRWTPAATGDPVVPSLTAFVPIWKRPFMAFNDQTYAASLLRHIGVEVIFGSSQTTYPTVTDDEVTAAAPDLVLAPSEPYPFAERHRAELERFAPVHFVDGQDLFWWGARTADAVRRLKLVIEPLK